MPGARAKALPLTEPNPRAVARRHLRLIPPHLAIVEPEFDAARWNSNELDDDGPGVAPAGGR